VYFNQAPVFSAGGRGATPAAPSVGVGQVITPNAAPLRIQPYEQEAADVTADGVSGAAPQRPRPEDVALVQQQSGSAAEVRPRVVLEFASDPGALLLSGTLAGGQNLAGRPAAIDARVGNGHVLLFAIRPFWRWQTHGTYTLGFNALMNWNDLDAGATVGGVRP
jgi:hypothetical protein